MVITLYEALRSRDGLTVQRILAADLEWWFHGPPTYQFLMRLLTGSDHDDDRFEFIPESVTSLGPLVIAEGCDRGRSIYWVHACTVTDDGVITQVREYFNTSLTVTRLGSSGNLPDIVAAPPPSSSSQPHNCTSVWESSLSGQAGKSVPGLVLAI